MPGVPKYAFPNSVGMLMGIWWM